MRKHCYVDYVQSERMSKVIPYVIVESNGSHSSVTLSDVPDDPYKGVPSDSFSIQSVVDSGQAFLGCPSIQGSNTDSRDALDDTISKIKFETEEYQRKKKISDSYNKFKESLGI